MGGSGREGWASGYFHQTAHYLIPHADDVLHADDVPAQSQPGKSPTNNFVLANR